MRRVRPLAAVIALVALGVACVPDVATGGPVGANQAFRGVVNGRGDGVVVTTVCPGPVATGYGHPAGGQTVAAVLDPAGPGNTGDNAAVWVEPDSSSYGVLQIQEWGTAYELPTDVRVPCDGKGMIVFDPCFGFVGCRGAARPDVVDVVFRNIAD